MFGNSILGLLGQWAVSCKIYDTEETSPRKDVPFLADGDFDDF